MHLHPRAQTVYINANGKHIQSVDLRTGLLLQTFATDTGDDTADQSNDDIQIRFNISPCGTFLLTTAATNLYGWNVLNGRSLPMATFRLPLKHSHHYRRRQLSAIDYHPNNYLVAVTVYGVRGDPGLYLLSHASADDAQPKLASSITEPPFVRNKTIENQDLAKIIKRIDDIFLLPQNKTDDSKANVAVPPMTTNRSKIPVPLPRRSIDAAAVGRQPSDESSVSGTFTVHHKSDDDENRTFSVHEQNGDGGTYNVVMMVESQQGGDDSDATTISESL